MVNEQELRCSDGNSSVETERTAIRILFVTASDDDPDVLRDFGNRPQFSVSTTRACDVLDRLKTADVDCLVYEYPVTDGNGLDVFTAIRREYPILPLVLFSTEEITGLADKAIAAGATDYVYRPPDDSFELLAHRIRAAANRHETQQRQDEFHRIYRALETAQEGIALLDDGGEFIYVNRAYADLHDYDPDEMLGRTWMHKYANHEVERVQDDVLPLLYEEGTWSGKTEGLRSDGSTFLENHSLSTTADGGLVCTIRDITEKEKRKELVQYYRSVVEDVFDESEVGVFILDSSFDVAWTNQAVERYFGLEGTAVEGREMTELIDTHLQQGIEEPETFVRRLTDAHEVNTIEEFQLHVLPVDGRTECHLEYRGQPIESGEYAGGRLELYYDITKQKKREKKLEQFADIVSHDLRNPLSIAQMYLGEARRDGREENFAEVEHAHDRMETMIANLLSMAQGGQSIDGRTSVSLRTVTERAWGQTKTTDVSLEAEGCDRVISANEDRLQAVFENLFRNAVEHGGSDVTVRVGPLDGGFYVADSGPGIPPEKRAQVFEYGYSDSSGTGLGLAIVHEIITEHDWEITVTEAVDGGTRFEIRGVEFDTSDVRSSR